MLSIYLPGTHLKNALLPIVGLLRLNRRLDRCGKIFAALRRLNHQEVVASRVGKPHLCYVRTCSSLAALAIALLWAIVACAPLPNDGGTNAGASKPDRSEQNGNLSEPNLNNANPSSLQDKVQPSGLNPDPLPTPLALAPLSQTLAGLDLTTLPPSNGHNAEITGLFISKLGRNSAHERLLASDSKGQVLVWDLQTGRAYQFADLKGRIDIMSISPDERFVAFALRNILVIYSLGEAKERYRQSELEGRILDQVFSSDAASIATARTDGFVYRWKFLHQQEAKTMDQQEKTLERYGGQASMVSALAYHPFGRFFLGAAWDGRLHAFLPYDVDYYSGEYDENLFKGRFLVEKATRVVAVRKDGLAVDRLIFTADGQLYFVAVQNGMVELWRTRGFEKVSEAYAHPGALYDMALSPLEHHLATIGRDGTVRVWKVIRQPMESTRGTPSLLDAQGETRITAARKVIFKGEDFLLVGDEHGKIREIELAKLTPFEKELAPWQTPTPTPVPSPGMQ